MKNDVVKFANFKQNVEDKRDEELSEAFAWNLETQRSHGFYSEPTKLVLDKGDYVDDGDGSVIISLFVDKKTGRAIMRRDWPEDMCLKFNTIINLEEIKRVAPKNYEKMIKNGLDMYHREGKGFKAYYLREKRRKKT